MSPTDATPPADSADAPATPLQELRGKLAVLERAPLLHKGEAAGAVMAQLLDVLEDQDYRLRTLEAGLAAIVHPARQRPPK